VRLYLYSVTIVFSLALHDFTPLGPVVMLVKLIYRKCHMHNLGQEICPALKTEHEGISGRIDALLFCYLPPREAGSSPLLFHGHRASIETVKTTSAFGNCGKWKHIVGVEVKGRIYVVDQNIDVLLRSWVERNDGRVRNFGYHAAGRYASSIQPSYDCRQ